MNPALNRARQNAYLKLSISKRHENDLAGRIGNRFIPSLRQAARRRGWEISGTLEEEFPSRLNGTASTPTILPRGNDNVRADQFEDASRHR